MHLVITCQNQPAFIYLQNSGLGNLINPITSLTDKQVYGIPAVIFIGWRGFKGEKDEPQHKKMGTVSDQILETIGYKYFELIDIKYQSVIKKAYELTIKISEPVFILVKPGLFENINIISKNSQRNLISREKFSKNCIKFFQMI